MIEENKIIGDKEEENKLEKLIEQAKQDPVIQRAVNGSNGIKKVVKQRKVKQIASPVLYNYNFIKFKPNEISDKLLRNIENNIGFNKRGLIKQRSDLIIKEDAFIEDNAYLALAYFANGETANAKNLLEKIEKHIGFDEETGLVNHRDTSSGATFLEGNAALALAYFIGGEKQKGLDLLENIEKHFKPEKKTGLINFYSDKYNDISLQTNSNVLLTLCYLAIGQKKKGENLILKIEEYVGFNDSGLITSEVDDSVTDPIDGNVFLALAYIADGIKHGLTLIKNLNTHNKIDKKIEKHGLFNRTHKNKDYSTDENAALVLAYAAEAAYKENE